MNSARLLVLLVSLPLLLGSCGEKPFVKSNKPETELVNDNQPETEAVNDTELVKRQGVTYRINSEKPFTGKSVGFHPNGQKSLEANYKNGKEHGPWLMWHENGQKQIKGNYKNGLQQGLWIVWHKNGQRQIERNFKDGIESSVKYWNVNGKPVDTWGKTYSKYE